jgi:branched-chain amino acid aminotransferase
MTSPFKYLVVDGKLVPYDDARLHILTPAVKYAATAFDGLKAYWSGAQEQLILFRCRDHLARLLQSARLMGMEGVDYSVAELEGILLELLHANEVRQTIHIRPSLFVVGEGSLQARGPVSLGIVIVPGDAVISKKGGAEKPFRLSISSWRRIDDNTVSPRIKCAANYQNGRMALLQAQEDGYDGVVMLDGTGHVTEEPRACLFMVRDGVPITPPITSDILESINRETIMQLFQEEHGLEVREREVDRTEVYVADELFLCGSGMEIQPVGGVDRFSIGDGRPGPVTTAIRKSYMAIVSGDTDLHPEWRTPVYA